MGPDDLHPANGRGLVAAPGHGLGSYRRGIGFVFAAMAALAMVAGLGLAAIAGAAPLAAQTFDTGFASLAGDSDTPIEIEADELEVRDKEGVAVFTGNVTVRQEGAALQTQSLTVHYVQDEQERAAATPTNPGTGQEIARLEANGRVLVTSEGQAATGDRGFVDMQGKTMEIVGNVTLTQGPNVVTGDRLVVDLNDGKARVISESRVRVLLNPNSQQPSN